MSFLEIIPGLSVPVEGGARRVEKVGPQRRRSARGRAQDAGRGHHPAFSFRTVLAEYDEANSIANILRGRGDVIYFRDGLQGSAGTMPKEMGSEGAFELGLAGPFSGYDGGGFYGDDPSAYLVYDYQFGKDWDLNTEWTVMWFEYNTGDSTWHRTTMRSDGTFVFDGVIDNDRWEIGAGLGMEWEFSVFDGQIRMQAVGGDGGALHHAVVLPFIASDTVVDAFMTAEVPWGPLPMLYATGDLITTDHEYMFGSKVRESWVRADHLDGEGLLSNNLTINFDIEFAPSGWFQDHTVPSQGTTQCAAEPEPIDLAGGMIYAVRSNAVTSYVAGLSQRDDVDPTPTFTITAPGSGVYGTIVNEKPDGDPGWVRTASGVTGSFVVFRDLKTVGDAVVAICYASSNLTTLDIRDETGTLLASVPRAAGTHGNWAAAVAFSISTGGVLWLKGSSWASDPGSTVAFWQATGVEVGGSNGDEVVLRWKARTATANKALPVIGGASPPAATQFGNTYVTYNWLVTVDMLTGDMTHAQCVTRNPSTTANTSERAPGEKARGGVTYDAVNDAWHLVGNYAANDSAFSAGDIDVGFGTPSVFRTRAFVDSSAETGARGYLAKFDSSWAAERAVTYTGQPLPLNGSSRPFQAGTPYATRSGKILFVGSHNTGYAGTRTLQRDPTNYGALENGTGAAGDLVLYRFNSDYDVPDWKIILAHDVVGSNGFDVWDFKFWESTDGTKLFVNLMKNGGAFNDQFELVDGAVTVTIDAQESVLLVLDNSTGAYIAHSYTQAQSTNSYGKFRYLQRFDTGLAAEKTFAPGFFNTGTFDTGAGVYDQAGSNAYNVYTDSWAKDKGSNLVGVHMLAWDDDGEPIPALCHTSLVFASNPGTMTITGASGY